MMAQDQRRITGRSLTTSQSSHRMFMSSRCLTSCVHRVQYMQHTHQSNMRPTGSTCMLECVFVCDKWRQQSANCTLRSLDSGLSHASPIRIDAHQSKSRRPWRPRSLIWIVCTHRSRLPTVVVSEQACSYGRTSAWGLRSSKWWVRLVYLTGCWLWESLFQH